MRVRELLAANAFCLLALTGTGCAKVEQTVGEYRVGNDRQAPGGEPDRPRPPTSTGGEPGPGSEGGVIVSPLMDAGGTEPPTQEPISTQPPTAAAGRAGSGSPPIVIDASVPGNVSNDPECNVRFPERRGLDLYLMVDSNIALEFARTWDVISEGLVSFANDPRSKGTGVGVRYFGNTCEAADYMKPDVNINTLPGNAESIRISTRIPRLNSSPMLPALQGALMLQKARARELQAKQAVVLVSDGVAPDLTFACPYTPQAVAQEAKDGFDGEPSVETHIIAVGITTMVSEPLDALIERFGAFNLIAQGGGTEQAIPTSVIGSGAEFADALQRARRKASPCEYKLLPGAGINDFAVVRVSRAEVVPRVANFRGCATNRQGWYYATESEPTPITLCPATCSWVNEEDGNSIGMVRATCGQ